MFRGKVNGWEDSPKIATTRSRSYLYAGEIAENFKFQCLARFAGLTAD
jgi:hypothetical protein